MSTVSIMFSNDDGEVTLNDVIEAKINGDFLVCRGDGVVNMFNTSKIDAIIVEEEKENDERTEDADTPWEG